MGLTLHGIITDNMMLQADAKLRLAGRARPGEKIRVNIAGYTAEAKAGKNGCFEVFLGPLSCGGPHTLLIGGKKIKNVLIGDIWVCSGQSNMQWTVNDSAGADQEIDKAKYKNIRILSIPRSLSGREEGELPGFPAWQEVSPRCIKNFSAVGYYFGRELHIKTGRPIGLINSSWGGTRIEPWISMESFKKWEQYKTALTKYGKKFKHAAKKSRQPEARLVVDNPDDDTQIHLDSGNAGYNLGYARQDLDEGKMKTLELPGYWTEKGIDHVGAIWFRKTVNIPKNWLGNDLYLSLGAFVDFDQTYVNGESVGFTGKETPNFWDFKRKYVIPARILQAGKNVIAIRVFAHKTHGGSSAMKPGMYVSVINKPDKGEINISGKWKYIVEKELPRLFNEAAGKKNTPLDHETPTWIYNSMIAPLLGFPIKGAIWYQGESNASDPKAYGQLLPLLIRDWRKKWGLGKFPFYLVQLAGYKANDFWPDLREAQFKTLSIEENTGMASAIDIGDPQNIHPKNKQEVGRRLALNALAKDYGKNVEFSGPCFLSAERKGRKVFVSFSHAKGLKAQGYSGKLEGFELAPSKGNFLPARAKITGDTVILESNISAPVFLRYAWANYPESNLYNEAGLPAVPYNKKIN
ncbi:MAG: sialate O-acetylesterase [Candidatus Firestonebacteria bacterium]